MLLAASGRADWIALDGGGIMLVLIGWALAGCFALAGVVLVARASFPEARPRRTLLLTQAVFCFALVPLLGWMLPVVLNNFPLETHDTVALAAIVWAPALAAGCGWLVYRLSRDSR
jgi:hypothetical protein